MKEEVKEGTQRDTILEETPEQEKKELSEDILKDVSGGMEMIPRPKR